MKKIILLTGSIFIIVAVLFFSACSPDFPPPDETPQAEYSIDSLPGSVDPPYELDEEMLANLVKRIKIGAFGNIHSLIIIHNDSLVMEEYFRGWTRHMLHYCMSVTKSVTSALIGIAIDQGKIDGLDDKLLSFFPEYDDIENLDERKESIILEHVLTMTPGFTWDEASSPPTDPSGNPNPENDLGKMTLSSDWIKYMLDLPMSNDPGTKFVYNTGGAILLSGIIQNKTGQSAEEFAEDNLFSVLGITNWEWSSGPNGINDTGGGPSGGLLLHPVNMAMFGYLYLKNGLLNGEQIVPENWVKESTAKHIAVKEAEDYGCLWWSPTDNLVENHLKTNDLFFARGFAGQFIFIVPHLNMVVVTTSVNILKDYNSLAFEILFDHILPAVREK